MLPKNYHLPKEEWISFLKNKGVFMRETCPDCGVELFQRHQTNCDIAICSVCGGQRLSCLMDYHPGHNAWFASWRGYWPGKLEALLFHLHDEDKFFLINPVGGYQKSILLILDQAKEIYPFDQGYIIGRAKQLNAVVTTAFVSEDPKFNTELLGMIKKEQSGWIIPLTDNKKFEILENTP